jgi:adenylate kinase family enzyme
MKSCRIHITGASGAGVSTLGHALASELALPLHDTDDYFWQPTEPPYRTARERAERLRLMHEMFVPRAGWILSGSLSGWGDPLIQHFDLVVFLVTARDIRLQRLRAREEARFGTEAVAPGGWRHAELQKFIEWASRYEDGEQVSRNLVAHQAWLASLPCPVLRLDGARPLHELAGEVSHTIGGRDVRT